MLSFQLLSTTSRPTAETTNSGPHHTQADSLWQHTSNVPTATNLVLQIPLIRVATGPVTFHCHWRPLSVVGTGLSQPAEERPKEPALAAMAMAAATYSGTTHDAAPAPAVTARCFAVPYAAGTARSCSFSGTLPSCASGPSPAHTAAPPFPDGCALPGWPISDTHDSGDIERKRVWCDMDNDMARCLAGYMANRMGFAHSILPCTWCGHIRGGGLLSSRTSFWEGFDGFSSGRCRNQLSSCGEHQGISRSEFHTAAG